MNAIVFLHSISQNISHPAPDWTLCGESATKQKNVKSELTGNALNDGTPHNTVPNKKRFVHYKEKFGIITINNVL